MRHEARSARTAGTRQRHHHQHFVDLLPRGCGGGLRLYLGGKHAIEGITKSVDLEIAASGIRVNCVAPGPTDTGMLTRFTGAAENKAALVSRVSLARMGLSEELTYPVVFIASNDSSFITGHVLNVDGGIAAN
jgi:NAD(P)-dependent dehydrogenase (short-subunit alcohol dehydrogenase family)